MNPFQGTDRPLPLRRIASRPATRQDVEEYMRLMRIGFEAGPVGSPEFEAAVAGARRKGDA